MAVDVDISQAAPWAEKDKDASRRYMFDLAPLLVAGDELVACTWSAQPGVVVESSTYDGTSVSLVVSGGTVASWYALTANWQSLSGERDQFVFRLFIKEDSELVSPLGSALFPNRFTAVAKLRTDRLAQACATVLPKVQLSDDYLWGKLLAAEADIQRQLRVPLRETAFMPVEPTPAELDALAGVPWELDPGYDYDSSVFQGEGFGFLALRKKPLISVSRVRLAYPGPGSGLFDIPLDWLRVDHKYGHLRFVPAGSAFTAPLNAFLLQAVSGGRNVPQMIQVSYRAGLRNAVRDYPELVDVVAKQAVLKVIADAFLPQSGSISADGLSQSISIDMAAYADTIDAVLFGGKGAHGGLWTALHGIRLGVL